MARQSRHLVKKSNVSFALRVNSHFGMAERVCMCACVMWLADKFLSAKQNTYKKMYLLIDTGLQNF